MTIYDLVELHVEALFTHDDAGRLVRVRETNGGPAPRFFISRAGDGSIVRRYRHDVDDSLRHALEAASEDETRVAAAIGHEARAAAELARYADILGRVEPVRSTADGPAFCFPTILPSPYQSPDDAVTLVTRANVDVLHPHLPAWVPDVELSPPLLALLVDGVAVSVCGSVRITPRAREAGVDTAPAFRGRGYAPRVVAAWARTVRAQGVEPLYSTAWRNLASRAVARKLGLVHFGSDLHLT